MKQRFLCCATSGVILLPNPLCLYAKVFFRSPIRYPPFKHENARFFIRTRCASSYSICFQSILTGVDSSHYAAVKTEAGDDGNGDEAAAGAAAGGGVPPVNGIPPMRVPVIAGNTLAWFLPNPRRGSEQVSFVEPGETEVGLGGGWGRASHHTRFFCCFSVYSIRSTFFERRLHFESIYENGITRSGARSGKRG